MKTLQRVLTALVLAPPLYALIVWGPWWGILLLVTLVLAIMLTEYFAIVLPPTQRPARQVGVAVGLLFFLVVVNGGWLTKHLGLPDGLDLTAVTAALAVMALFLVHLFLPGDLPGATDRLARSVLGVFYVAGLLAFLPLLAGLTGMGWNGRQLTILLLAVVWMTDTGGFFFGKFLGRRKLYELISPKKTWAGAWGGTLMGWLGGWLFGLLVGLSVPWWHYLLLSLTAGTVGQVGDLCESLVKRSFGVKDSGALLPGHGGLLDRLDAVLFAAPVFYLYAMLVL